MSSLFVRRVLAAAAVLALAVSCTGGGAPVGVGRKTSPALTVPRAVHRATVLTDGRVLFTGGCSLHGCGGFQQARASEVFDPATQRFTSGPAMTTPRAGHTATLLPDGRVLLVGGYAGEGEPALSSAEVYDPQTNEFHAVGRLSVGRADHTATLMSDGFVLIAGGTTGARDTLSSTESFDPKTERFSLGAPLSSARAGHSAVVTRGQLVLVGGTADMAAALDTTDVLRNGRWSPGPRLREARLKHAAIGMPDQTVLVIGGATTAEGRQMLSTTEIMDIDAIRTQPGPALSEGQYKLEGAVTTLPDGRVVIAGGQRVDVYDPRTRRMSVLDDPPVARRSFITASTLSDVTVLVAGGYDSSISPTAQVRIVHIPEAA